MKTKLLILAALVVVIVALVTSTAVGESRSKAQKPVESPQVTSLKHQLKIANDQMKLHDATNNTAIANAGKVIQDQNQTITTLCTQVKAAKLQQPLCK